VTSRFLDVGLFDPKAVQEVDEYIFEDLLCRSDLAVWIGREKHRKSTLILQLAVSAALGRKFLHFKHGQGEPMPVVILDYESKANSFKKRQSAICRAMKLSGEDEATLQTHLKVILVRELRKKGIKVPRFTVRTQSKQEQETEPWWRQLAKEYPAGLYIFDPMRCLHSQDENDSNIEALLSKLRDVFPNAAIIIPHHMNRSSANTRELTGPVTLSRPDSLRAFANGARGSSAINAHADVVICQERRIEGDVETVYLGAYMKDAADVEPLPLVESDHESFYWIVSRKVPDKLRRSYETLRHASRPFSGEGDAVEALMTANSSSRATAYRHVKELRDGGFLLRDLNGNLAMGECSSEI